MRPALIPLLLLLTGARLGIAQQVITTVAGTNWVFPDNQPAATAPLGRVNSVAVHPNGTVYFADATANMVLRLSSSGTVQIVAGNGFQTYSGDGGAAVDASLSMPTGVAIDAAGNLYIADSSNFRIRKVDRGGIITTVAGTGENGTTADPSSALQAKLGVPRYVTVDKDQNLYFLDTNSQRIRRVAPNGVITLVAGAQACTAPATATFRDSMPALQFCFGDVTGLAVDTSGTLFIADNRSAIVVKVSGGNLLRVAGGGTAGQSGENINATNAELAGVSAIAVDSRGTLYLSESRRPRVRRVESGIINTIAGATSGFRDGGGAAAQFRAPNGLATDSSLNIYVADQENFRIRLISAQGTVSTLAGVGAPYEVQPGASATLSPLSLPYGLGLDSAQTLYIGDSFNYLVRELRQGNLFPFAGTGSAGNASTNNLPATSAEIGAPTNIAFDPSGNAYFVDIDNHVVRKVTPAGTISTVAGIAGTSGLGQEGVAATATPLNQPIQVVLDAANNIYIAEYGNYRIRRVNPAGFITTFAGNGKYEISGDGGQATQAGIGLPFGMVFDSTGAMFLASQFQANLGRIRRIATNGVISTVAGGGSLSAFVPPVQATLARLGAPAGLAIDSANNLFFTDFVLHAAFQLSGGTLKVVAGTSRPAFAGDGGPAAQASLNQPFGIAVDKTNNVYIADTYNNRVRKVLTPAQAPVFSADQSKLTFNTKKDGPAPLDQFIALRTSIAGLPYTAQSDQKWLTVTPSAGVAPGRATISADPTGMADGVYQGVVTFSAPGAEPATLKVAVTFTIDPLPPNPVIPILPSIVIDSTTRIFSFKTGDAPVSASLTVGTVTFLNFSATATVDNGNWLTLSAGSEAGSPKPTAPATISFTVNPNGLEPDTYAGKITLEWFSVGTGSTVSQVIPVVMTLVEGAPRILLSQNAINFTTVQGGGAPLPQQFVVLNDGAGTLSYSVDYETLKGGDDWIDVLGDGDDVDPGQIFLSSVSVAVDPTDLDPGLYTAHIRIADPMADNSPQTVTVYLTVLSSTENPGPDMAPGGVVFQANLGDRPGSKTISIANVQKQIISYKVVSDVPASLNWLAVAPDTGSVAARTTETRLKLQPDFSALTPGTYRAQVAVTFSDNTTRNIEVLSVLNPAPGSREALRQAENCVPVLSVVEPTGDSTITRTAGLTLNLKARLTTSCTNQDKVVLSVNGQPGIYMDPKGTEFNYTYFVKPTDTQLQIKFAPLSVQLVGGNLVSSGNSVVRNITVIEPVIKVPPPPVLKDVNNSVTRESRALIAPGSQVTITGDNLSDDTATADPRNPLPQLAGTSVEVAGVAVPITAVAPDKISFIVPYRLKRDSKQEIRVRRGDQESVSLNLVVARTQPGILSLNGSGAGQGKIYKITDTGLVLADASAPPTTGDTVVIVCAGLGDVASAVLPAGALPTPDDDVTTRSSVLVTIGGRNALVRRQSLSRTDVGQYEVEVEVPAGVVPGSAVPVKLVSARQPSPGTITMAIK